MAASFSLIIEDDAGKQIVVPFAKDVITIGRKEGNTIRLTERNVSRFHAKLERQTGGVLVEDLSSFNGVKLNGDRIAGKVLVTAGDVIEIGDYHLELRAAQAAKAAQQANVGPVGSKAGALQDNQHDAGGDEFEGDTQRWDPPAGGSPSVHPTQEDTMPHMPAQGGFGEGGGDTERLDLQHLQSLASQGGQSVPPPQPVGEPQSWPPPPGARPAAPPPQPMFGPGDLEPTARQPVANVPLGGIAPPPPPQLAPQLTPMLSPLQPSSSASPGPSLHEPTQDMPMPMPAPSPPRPPALSPSSAPPQQQQKPKRAAEETEQLRAAPAGPINPADDLGTPRLVVLNTIFSGSTFPLKAMENVLGRTDDNDIVLEHRSVSRNHAKLVREGERVRILDLKSANGVLVNGEEVEQHVLKSGDIIELGRLKLRFVPVGERFAVSPEEIERSRLQDAAGDDAYDDSAQTVNVTSPLRAPRPADGEPPVVAQKKPVVLYAVLAGLAVLVVILAIVVVKSGGGDDPKPTDPPTDPTPVGALPTTPPPPVEPTPTPPTPTPTPPPTEVKTTTTPPEPPLEPVEATPTKEPKNNTPTKKKEKEVDFEASLREAQQDILQGEFNKAVPILKELEKIKGDDPRIHRNLGISYARLRDNANAARHYKKYLELNPGAADADKVREILNKSK